MYLCAFEGREGVKGVPTYLPTYLYVIESVCVCVLKMPYLPTLPLDALLTFSRAHGRRT